MRKVYQMLITAILMITGTTIHAQECGLFNMTGSGSLAFYQLNIGGGRMYVKFDPAGDNSAGNPGCNLPYPFQLQTATYDLIDAGYFSPGEGAGTLTYRLRVYDLANPNDPCSGIGPVLATSPTYTLTTAGSTNVHPASHTFNLVVNNPFFVAYEVLTWSGDLFQVPAPIRNTQSIPACRQYVSMNGGAQIDDHQEFFGFVGWYNAWITGDPISSSCIPPTTDFNVICNAQAPTQFFVYANTTNLGNGGPYTITNNVSAGTGTISETGIYYVGAFNNGSEVVVTLTSQADTNCFLSSAPIAMDCSTVSVNEISPLSLTELFPNPATSFVNISTEMLSGLMNLRVFDVSGKMVLQKNWTVSGSNHVVSVDSLKSGVYTFLIENDGHQEMRKLFIQ
jgi:hypothetical protein